MSIIDFFPQYSVRNYDFCVSHEILVIQPIWNKASPHTYTNIGVNVDINSAILNTILSCFLK